MFFGYDSHPRVRCFVGVTCNSKGSEWADFRIFGGRGNVHRSGLGKEAEAPVRLFNS